MCDAYDVIFAATNLSEAEVRGKRVLEFGALDVNGSLRRLIEYWGPKEYIGLDLEKGPGVDVVCRAEDAVEFWTRGF